MNETLTGKLLVASSLADAPVYARGVCLVVHQDDSNVIGVMLNRPMKPNLAALAELFGDDRDPRESSGNRLAEYETGHPQSEADPTIEQPSVEQPTVGQPTIGESLLGTLHFGGPRSGPVVAIHQTSRYAEAETGEGIYVAAQRQHLEELVRDQPAPYRLIVGHLGWELGEMATELERGIWHILPATTDAVFSSADDMWPRLVRRATSNSMAGWIGIPDVVGAGAFN